MGLHADCVREQDSIKGSLLLHGRIPSCRTRGMAPKMEVDQFFTSKGRLFIVPRFLVEIKCIPGYCACDVFCGGYVTEAGS